MNEGIPFATLLAYTEAEHARWEQFFLAHPEALDLPCDVAAGGTIRELVFHIFMVNLFFAHRLLGLELPDFQAIPHSSIEQLFAVDADATGKLQQFLSQARLEDWNEKVPLRLIDQTISKRKAFSQAMLHGVHHRAQLATALRQQGLKQDWKHDFVLSDTME